MKIEYSVKRIYQHQSGQTFAAVEIILFGEKAADASQIKIEGSFPLQNLEGRVQAYAREYLSAMKIQKVTTEIEI
jgi:hypothetical protein